MLNTVRRFTTAGFTVALLAVVIACSNTARAVVEDTKDNTAKVAAAAETADVKTALMAAKDLDTGAIDVDTYADTKTVVLRGSVPTAEQKARAEQIAREHAPTYKIENKLAVVPR
jgi:osmotically-inducible protein OsmY